MAYNDVCEPEQNAIIERYFRSLKEEEVWPTIYDSIDSLPVEGRKRLIRTFVRRLELDPNKKEAKISFYPDLTAYCLGVGSGT